MTMAQTCLFWQLLQSDSKETRQHRNSPIYSFLLNNSLSGHYKIIFEGPLCSWRQPLNTHTHTHARNYLASARVTVPRCPSSERPSDNRERGPRHSSRFVFCFVRALATMLFWEEVSSRKMHSLWLTGRLISRALWNGISNVASVAEPGGGRRPEPQLVSAVCGFSKDRKVRQLVKGQFGDDAWFTTRYNSTDVLGEFRHITKQLTGCLVKTVDCCDCSVSTIKLSNTISDKWQVSLFFCLSLKIYKRHCK